jgi:hypothetical protein
MENTIITYPPKEFVGTLSPEQYSRYNKNKLDDSWLRDSFKVPKDKYYTVSEYPENTMGNIWIVKDSHRTVENKKISKSDQKST